MTKRGTWGRLREVVNWGGKRQVKERGNEGKTALAMFKTALNRPSYFIVS